MYQAIIFTGFGKIYLAGTESGLTRVSFRPEDIAGDVSAQVPEVLQEAEQQLQAYFEGSLTEFHLKLDFGAAPEFHKEVWNMVKIIPYGRTRSYSEIAEAIGHAKASRAVGHANGMNPLPIVIPCHRVIGKDGSLTGYYYGVEMKRRLLGLESPGKYMTQASLMHGM